MYHNDVDKMDTQGMTEAIGVLGTSGRGGHEASKSGGGECRKHNSVSHKNAAAI